MDAALMLGRGTGLFFIILFSARGSRAQKGDGCGHTVLGTGSGSLASLGYPFSYPTDSVCEWEISVSVGDTLLLRVAELDIHSQNCQVSYLRLFNGIGGSRTEIIKLCHGDVSGPRMVKSDGHQVTVQFMSGPQNHGRGFFLSYASSQQQDLITCLDKGNDFTEAEFSKFCPAGCLTDFGEVSGTIPHGYRDSSLLCLSGIHAGVVSNVLGGAVSVVSSKGIPHYDSSLANNVTSVAGNLSPSLFTFKTSGCYGTLGLESGVVSDAQISASSVWEWARHGEKPSVWASSGSRLKRAGLPWAAVTSDTKQWIQVDLKREKKITGIITTGSSLPEYQFYVSAYRVQYSSDGQDWTAYKDSGSNQQKVFQGNTNYLHEVRNNFIPPIEARFIRINPYQWHQRIALKMELLGCQLPAARPRIFNPDHLPPKRSTVPPQHGWTTHTPDVRNTTVPQHPHNEVALVAVLVPVLVVVLTAPVLVIVCAWLWKSRKSPEVTYDLPHWDRTVWWKSMKQLLPSKLDGEDCVRYSSTARADHQRPRVEPAEYAQPLVSGTMASLGQRSTFKPEEGADPEYDAPLPPEQYHAYAEPLPASGAEYAIPITIDRANHVSGSTLAFRGRDLLSQTDSNQSGRSMYDTPKSTSDQVAPADGQVYQVPQNSQNTPCQETD
ncbi:discoidin, CUB and LCCL domain-containing protein 2 isoform X2 [Astyanax mexicanus]|uniref:Discoidin, CUB and LCCL domain-containing protein 2 n=1 Tax=Astyanax mexicanus TaxID=7994 RepID=A0A8T2LG69_ASTMX|nr:discoidin, CUB and LCCL domain-containing protein 2 isoform X2 [Astyanax mexicanus]KAG9271018.1 discoidin, CUB and LCCL domain-containing protein 2 [Astyanax mexicanus]